MSTEAAMPNEYGPPWELALESRLAVTASGSDFFADDYGLLGAAAA